MIFRIKGLYVSVSYYFVLMIAWVVFSGKIKTFFLCALALLIHEAGHITTIWLQKERINIFYILPFGFCCKLKNQNKISEMNMIKILLAGPVTSLLVAGLFLFWTKEFALINLVIGVFNLLPLGSLDGGRIFKFFSSGQ